MMCIGTQAVPSLDSVVPHFCTVFVGGISSAEPWDLLILPCSARSYSHVTT